jgi:hypothetical protein
MKEESRSVTDAYVTPIGAMASEQIEDHDFQQRHIRQQKKPLAGKGHRNVEIETEFIGKPETHGGQEEDRCKQTVIKSNISTGEVDSSLTSLENPFELFSQSHRPSVLQKI